MRAAKPRQTEEHMTNSISPQQARDRIQQGALLLDVRSYPEWRSSHVAGATLVPLDVLRRSPTRGALGDEVLVICQSGHRSQLAAQLLTKNGVNARSIEGGLNAWQSDGLPTQKADGEFIELERQIRIAAGALVLTGLLVPRARALSYFVGAGLVITGFLNWCGLGVVLGKMPWNRARGDERERSLQSQDKHD